MSFDLFREFINNRLEKYTKKSKETIMVTIYLVRHGQTEWNVTGKMQGWGNGELTESGIRDALSLGNRLQDIPIDVIYSSTSKRAYQTAELIAGERTVPIIKDDRLREMSFGDWEGRLREEIEKEFSAEYKAFWETPHLYERNSGELFTDVLKRAEEMYKDIIASHPSETVLIVSHSIFLRILTAYLRKLSLDKLFTQTYIGNASLTKIQVTDGIPEFIFEGDRSHCEE